MSAPAREFRGRRFVAAFVGRWTALSIVVVSFLPGPTGDSHLSPGRALDPTGPSANITKREWVEIRNVDLHLTEQIVIRVQSLNGEVLATTPGQPPALDDATSFRIRVTSGKVALTGADLGAILNRVVFAYPNAPLRDLRVRTDGSEIIQTGIMHKGIDLRFRLRGTLDLTPDGRVRIHPSAVHILGLNGESVLHLVGLHLESLLDLRGAHGASVKGDDLFLDPMAILPPPAIDGRLASIRVEGEDVIQEFVRLPDDSIFRTFAPSDTVDHNFIYFRGGQLRFGKLLMTDTDLQIIGPDNSSVFDMSLPHYSRQLVAGRSRTLSDLGLVVHMPNFSTLQRADSNPKGSSQTPGVHIYRPTIRAGTIGKQARFTLPRLP